MKRSTIHAEKRAERERARQRKKGELPPPPNVLPRHKRNSWRWKYVPY